MILAARFGGDTKKAYLYTQMLSDFGKSFVFSIFESFGLGVRLSMKELKKAYTGDPVGLTVEEFATAWVILFDEVKYIPSEIKEITHTLNVTPKGQPRTIVPVYMKWLADAEGVTDLLEGVETQFANRISYISTGERSLVKRRLYKRDNKTYYDAVKYEIFKYLYSGANTYKELGRKKASIKANKVIKKFRKKYAIKATIKEETEEFFKFIIEDIKEKSSNKWAKNTTDPIQKKVNDNTIVHDKTLYFKRIAELKALYKDYCIDKYGDDYQKIFTKYPLFRKRFSKKQQTRWIKKEEFRLYGVI